MLDIPRELILFVSALLAEFIDVLAARAPGLREALERTVAEGTPYVILDGEIAGSDRCHEKKVSRKVRRSRSRRGSRPG